MVLYRKYRPQKFVDIVGQEHIKVTLANALASKKFGHGYLFAGPKGSGKTTIARILAKALNCTGRKLGKDSFEPCNKCVSCKEVTTGKALDLIEIDAASNRGIDEIRILREKIRFAPTSSAYKIYIIDEVHMLTREAFNALLKTLEEPPPHAIFLMATTEPQKILPTILSRVQRFDFHKATLEEITKLLEKIVKAEEIKIDEEAIQLLAQLSFGSYRDSLSLLEQISSVRQTSVSKITLEQIQQILGLAQEKSIFDFTKYLAEKNRHKLFEILSKLYFQGVEMENFTIKLIELLRKIALYKLGENQLYDLTKDQKEMVINFSEKFEIDDLMALIEKLTKVLPQVKSANLPTLPLEMIVFELTQNNASTDYRLPTTKKKKPKLKIKDDKEDIKLPKINYKVGSHDFWPQVIIEARSHNHHLAALLRDAALAKSDAETITLAFKFKFHSDVISGKKNTQLIEGMIQKITGKNYQLVCIVDPDLVIKKPTDSDEELLNGAKEVFEVE